MIQKITSKKVDLPDIWLVENEDDFNELPRGLPYIIGTQKELEFIRIFLEFQVLIRSCRKTNLSINWLRCLEKLGYRNVTVISWKEDKTYSQVNAYMHCCQNFQNYDYIGFIDIFTKLDFSFWISRMTSCFIIYFFYLRFIK